MYWTKLVVVRGVAGLRWKFLLQVEAAIGWERHGAEQICGLERLSSHSASVPNRSVNK